MGNHIVELFALNKVATTAEKIVKEYGKYKIKGKYVYKQFGNVLPVSKRIQIELSDHYMCSWIWVDGFRWVKYPMNILNSTKAITSGLSFGATKSPICYEVSDKKYTSKEFRQEIENELEEGLEILTKFLDANKEEIYRLVSEINSQKSNTIAGKTTIRNNLRRIGLTNISNIDD